MSNTYDPIDEALNTSSIEVSNTPENGCVKRKDKLRDVSKEVQQDYDYTRSNLYSLIEKGQESLNGIMELAGESASPRAYEVAGQIIKSVADTTDKLMELQKKLKDVDEEKTKTTNNVTNNAAVTHTMEVGNWYHWVVTYAGNTSGRTRKFYMNGEHLSDYDTSIVWSQTGNTGGGENIYFGGRNNNGNFVKAWAIGLDEVAIFDEEKDADWVSSKHNGGTPSDLTEESGLVGYWRFEEGSGTTVKDLSGNGNHGTLTTDDTGLPTWSTDIP